MDYGDINAISYITSASPVLSTYIIPALQILQSTFTWAKYNHNFKKHSLFFRSV